MTRHWSAAVAAAVAATALAGSSAAGQDETPETAAVTDIPQVAQTPLTVSSDGRLGSVVLTVHGVRRVAGGTVLYWSVGVPEGIEGRRPTPTALWGIDRLGGRYGGKGEPREIGLVDVAGGFIYEPLIPAEGEPCLCTRVTDLSLEEGEVSVLYAVMPQLPPETAAVDVRLGFGTILHDVPVEEGVLEPAAPAEGRTVMLGQEWPEVDLAAVSGAFDPADAITPLELDVGSADGAVLTEVEQEVTTVNLAADVLFAFGESTLDSSAEEVIAAAAEQVNASGQPGVVQVVGHTDNVGSNSLNQALSQERAAAVAEVLDPLLDEGFEIEQEGAGEGQPAVSNDTERGRALNRRVAIVFETEGAS